MEGRRRGLASFVPSNEEDGKENIVSDITQLVGWTPLVELKTLTKKEGLNVRLVAKIESYQPLSSVKDRSALRMIEDAEEKGLIQPGITTLVEPTGGNLGIGLAYIASRKGYKFIAVMPSNYALEKRMLMLYLGADVSVTDSKLGFQESVDRIEQLKEQHPNVHVLDQFSNPANPEAHFTTTGPEIWKDTAGRIDILVLGFGTGGTLSGAGKYLKMKNPTLKIVAVEPAESALISGGQPGCHNIQGLGPGFISDNVDVSCIDEVVLISTEEAMIHARRVAREEGLLVGISSGANLAACLKVASRVENNGKMIVTIFPSGGERYISTQLFDEAIQERHENSRLKSEMDKIQEENHFLREINIKKTCCPNCGFSTMSKDTAIASEEQKLRIENARLKAESYEQRRGGRYR